LVDEACTIVVPRKPRGNRDPETARSPVEAVVVMPVIASRCEVTRAASRRSVRAYRGH
jgi:hypothetical protein